MNALIIQAAFPKAPFSIAGLETRACDIFPPSALSQAGSAALEPSGEHRDGPGARALCLPETERVTAATPREGVLEKEEVEGSPHSGP